MALKRGSERESCDFCHRRKVKCDRRVRARQGIDSCTQCAARPAECLLDDSDDIRLRRRRIHHAPNDSLDVTQGLGSPSSGTAISTQQPTPSSLYEQSVDTTAVEDPNGILPSYMSDLFTNEFFTLSDDSMFFLDQVFADDLASSIAIPTTDQHTPPPTQTSLTENDRPPAILIYDNYFYSSLQYGPEQDYLKPAVTAYFELAAPYLPILLEDAFWNDYNAGSCSPTLIYAIACRGMCYINLDLGDKWDLQQKLALVFRESFLTARSTASDDGVVPLDDLEALALMVDFEYESTESEATQANLGRLFLKHESLVLMMLQSRSRTGSGTPDTPSALARAEERWMLLYWHVYGLDAFHCLDRKQISHIPGDSAGGDEVLRHLNVKGYFDAILALAIIARKTARLLCGAAARRKGVDPDAVNTLYDLLRQWRSTECPPNLRMSRDGAGNMSSIDAAASAITPATRHDHLHRTVLWALELNCLMQIESCYSAYGMQPDTGMRAEATVARIEYESLRALQDISEATPFLVQHMSVDKHGVQRSVVDLAPVLLRNVFAGMCNWSCERGIRLCCIVQPTADSRRGESSTPRGRSKEGPRGAIERVQAYIKTAETLRNMVATASSYKDTANILRGLDERRASLESEASGRKS